MEFFPELAQLERAAAALSAFARVEVPATVTHKGRSFPLITISLGSQDPQAPVFGLIGGVHGLEKIGTDVVLSYLEHLVARLEWDESLRWQLSQIRMIFMPLVNPAGMLRKTRSNGNGVDLMRNSPSLSEEGATPFVGGQRFSRYIPWYMGEVGKLETESQVLIDFIERECFSSSNAIVIDVHSGFGLVDQLWFPYARSKKPYPNLAEVVALKTLMDQVTPNHIYRFEPQALNYTTHGDLWDYVYDLHRERNLGSERRLIPLTLELGSWNWVKKNPLQLFSALGAFNPIKPHRRRRALRRHLPLFDFMTRATVSPKRWLLATDAEREFYQTKGLELWYKDRIQAPASIITVSGR